MTGLSECFGMKGGFLISFEMTSGYVRKIARGGGRKAPATPTLNRGIKGHSDGVKRLRNPLNLDFEYFAKYVNPNDLYCLFQFKDDHANHSE